MTAPSEYVRSVEEERRQKDGFMTHHPESPFVDAAIPGFTGLRYFPVDPKYRVPARLERLPKTTAAFLRTNRDGEMECLYVGDLCFDLEGEPLRLRVFFAGERVGLRVFIPFRDATCREESYGPGRYLTLELTEDDRYDVDFNLAFNPYCAYTDAFECGFPPSENDLPVRIAAGEKVWSQSRNPAGPSTAILEMTQQALASRAPSNASPTKTSRAKARASRTVPRAQRTANRAPKRKPVAEPRTSAKRRPRR
ncbi:MAG: DUF1684 domain-containing protein [Thermoplasmata archaeon]|nr:DUF1684 domain-containing protein [Thermoplasmata archaeon]